jgi:hypothetical protein
MQTHVIKSVPSDNSDEQVRNHRILFLKCVTTLFSLIPSIVLIILSLIVFSQVVPTNSLESNATIVIMNLIFLVQMTLRIVMNRSFKTVVSIVAMLGEIVWFLAFCNMVVYS